MAQILRQRSPVTQAPAPSPEPAAPKAELPVPLSPYLQRLQEEAKQINELAQQQEIAIQRFQRSAKGLAFLLLKQPEGSQWQVEHFCQLHPVAIAQVKQDNNGKLILTSTAIDLYQDERDASANAQEVRALHRHQLETQQLKRSAPFPGPLPFLNAFWQSLVGGSGSRSQLTPLDALIWFGGGLIGRLALELALAAVPAIWPWLVGATIGAVALALYRLLFAPQAEMTFVIRLFLALVGLAIGGQI
jgi:hypothetical protein